MNISQAAKRAGLSAKALRYYESINLISPSRSPNGYREYSHADVDILQFIQRARSCGFSVDEVRALLELHRNPARHSHDAKVLVEEKLQQVERQLEVLKSMRKTLRGLADSCAGDDSPECAILNQLASGD
ncbi:Cu(I)-responsive transcriptional regulator [Microbulbifer sp. ALW1]|uniref:Cu(I)-responsive transcriptional regulator n=1 Tax=Microbulbifer sp. (strain ALW1) TaxID=1516059 RepID=UPI0013576226|nr:Cu(I)-responsive transcriptional regulator [Microbulbifer sp. ALW1]